MPLWWAGLAAVACLLSWLLWAYECVRFTICIFSNSEWYREFAVFSFKLTAVHVDHYCSFASQHSPFSLSLSLFLFLFLTSFRMTFYFISFPPGKLRETWIFVCYQIWCLVRVSHYQGYVATYEFGVFSFLLFFFVSLLTHTERKKK